MIKTCPQCKTEFKAQKRNIICCSKICANIKKSKPRPEVSCVVCGKEFISRVTANSKYKSKTCSRKCAYAAIQRGEYKNCLGCGKEFYSTKNNKVCSLKCRSLAPKKKYYETNCIQCGAHFISKYTEDYISRNPIKKPKLCSNKCRFDNHNVKVERSCEVCGKKKMIAPSTIKYSGARFCSKRCNGLYHSGENSALYKNGNTSLQDKIRKGEDYRNWKVSVFIRDNRTCQGCGYKGSNIEAHHKKPQSLFPELRFDLGNGLTLCKDCHKKTESYMNRKMTREHYEML